ncbi:MAG: DUF2156 domain-containing protein [Candidatus Brocadiia bacterium]
MDNIESIPTYPQNTGLTWDHQPLLDTVLKRVQPAVSELTFAYLWGWRRHTRCRLSRVDGALLVICDTAETDETYAFYPLCSDSEAKTELIDDILRSRGRIDRFDRVPETEAKTLRDKYGLAIKHKRARDDYVHAANDLRQLPGTQFDSKRNQISQFERACPDAEFQVIDETLARQCRRFTRQWLKEHPKNDLGSLQREVKTTEILLNNFSRLGLQGGALLDGDRILAFALGEPLNDNTFIERVEKADTSYPGSYQAINRAFARNIAEEYKWINREQDMGVHGLRRAKQSYHPHHMVKKYEIRNS